MARVLVVDDEAGVREVLRRCLVREGHSVSTAGDGSEGLEVAHEVQPELIFSDVRMPRMNGVDLVKALRGEGQTMPIVLMSGYTGDLHDSVQALLDDHVVAEVLVKPFDHQVVVRLVRQLTNSAGPSPIVTG